ncbi:MAG: hypothetical protein K2X35_03080 [Bryobacteraceae bacterium]|nr:hypothetical protein [Bryobacteraceae bacterium]
MRLLLVLWLPAALLAQQPAYETPPLDANDPEGLVSSPNPAIRHAWKRKVFWKANYNPYGPEPPIPAYTPAERQQAIARLDALAAALKATPTGSEAEGFWVNEARLLRAQQVLSAPSGVPPARLPLIYETGLFPFYHEDILSNGRWRLSVKGETESVYYTFNRLPGALKQPVVAEESRGRDRAPVEFHLRPRVTGTLSGLPVYDGTALLVLRPGRDPWVAVPLGRALKAVLPNHEKDRQAAESRLASLKAKNEEVQSEKYETAFRENFEKSYGNLRTTRPSGYETRLRSMERELAYNRERAAAEANPGRDEKGLWYWNPVDAAAEAARRLAALTAEQAAQPSCLAPFSNAAEKQGRYYTYGTVLAAGTSPGCHEIVMTNWDYFDFQLPRSAAQILWINDFGRCAKLEGDRIVSFTAKAYRAPPQGCFRHAQMWRELDWSRISALLHP